MIRIGMVIHWDRPQMATILQMTFSNTISCQAQIMTSHYLKRWWPEYLRHICVTRHRLDTYRSIPNGWYFADVTFKWISFIGTFWILFRISLKFVPVALVHVMTWHRTGQQAVRRSSDDHTHWQTGPQPVDDKRTNVALSATRVISLFTEVNQWWTNQNFQSLYMRRQFFN